MELCGVFYLAMEGRRRCGTSEHHMFVDKLGRGMGPIICVFHTSISIMEDAYYVFFFVGGGIVSGNRLI